MIGPVEPVAAIVVVVPAHDEEAHLGACLAAIANAITHPDLDGVGVHVVVALDACRDASAAVAAAASPDAVLVRLAARSPGRARRAGAAAGLARTRAAPASTWVATTDADSEVPPGWLAAQLRLANLGWDGVAGTVEVGDWDGHHIRVRRTYTRLLASRLRPGGEHTHVYGANLGVRASAYLAAGGFPRVALAEEVELWARLAATGHRLLQTSEVVVTTSGRRDPRAVGGLGDLLLRL